MRNFNEYEKLKVYRHIYEKCMTSETSSLVQSNVLYQSSLKMDFIQMYERVFFLLNYVMPESFTRRVQLIETGIRDTITFLRNETGNVYLRYV